MRIEDEPFFEAGLVKVVIPASVEKTVSTFERFEPFQSSLMTVVDSISSTECCDGRSVD
jgi:hypothetical protein